MQKKLHANAYVSARFNVLLSQGNFQTIWQSQTAAFPARNYPMAGLPKPEKTTARFTGKRAVVWYEVKA